MNEPSRHAALWGWARTCYSLLWVLQNVERRVFQGTECLERQFIWLHSSLKASPGFWQMPEAYSWILMSHLFNKLNSWPHSVGQYLPHLGSVFTT